MILRLFSWFHILTLLLPVGIVVGLYFLLRRRSPKVQDAVILGLMLVNVLQHYFKMFVWPHMWGEAFGIEETAKNMCAFLIMFSPVFYLVRGVWRDFLTYVGTAAGLFALVYPIWFINADILTWEFVRFFVCHALLMIASILPVLLGRHKLSFRHFWKMGLCFLAGVTTIFLNWLCVMRVQYGPDQLERIWKAMMAANPIWMMHPPAKGFGWVVELISWFSPRFLFDGDYALPILWYAVPLWLGFTIVGFFVYWAVDREGAKTFFEKVKAIFAKIIDTFTPKTQEK